MRRSYAIIARRGRANRRTVCEQIFAADSEVEAQRRLKVFREANPHMAVELAQWPLGKTTQLEDERKEGLVYE